METKQTKKVFGIELAVGGVLDKAIEKFKKEYSYEAMVGCGGLDPNETSRKEWEDQLSNAELVLQEEMWTKCAEIMEFFATVENDLNNGEYYVNPRLAKHLTKK